VSAEPATDGSVRVGFISLGCPKNLVDAQIMAGRLLDQGLVLAESPERSQVVVVNTCAFIEAAREESIDAILEACALKTKGSVRAVVVAGCLSQRYQTELAESLPEVDAFIGLDELDRLPAVVRSVAGGARGLYTVSAQAAALFEPSPGRIVVFSGGPHAYLKIAEGCNHACAFCAIPAIRGRHRSRAQQDIVAEAAALLEAGYRELNLISQDTMFYGRDRDDGASLVSLLRALDGIGGAYRIRILYGYPSAVTAELLEAMAGARHVCRYLDVPVQHVHPAMLRAMLRAETVDAVAALPARARRALPGVALRTTCLVGFPGETEEHFAHLEAYVREAAFDHLGVFVYSPEEGTPAAARPDRPPPEVAEERRRRLLLAQRENVARKAAALIGTPATALLESGDAGGAGGWLGRTGRQAPDVDGVTRIRGAPAEAGIGDFVPVVYTGGEEYDLLARCS